MPETQTSSDPFPLLDYIIPYEQGELSDGGVLTLFAHLISTEMAWSLQGFYGRAAAHFIESGFITREGALTEAGQEIVDDDGDSDE